MAWRSKIKKQKRKDKKMALKRDDPSQNDASSAHKETQPAPERYVYPPLHSSIEVNFPRRIEEKYDANQRKQETRDRWKVRIEIGTALFIAISVVVNYFMWNEMGKTTEANKISADAAAASVQAWIVPDEWSYRGIEGDRIIFDIDFKNIGKTVALDAGFNATFQFFEGGTLSQIPTYQPYECPEIHSKPGVIPPDGRWENVAQTERYSRARLDMLANKKAFIFIHGCAVYRDILSDKEHVTEMALVYTGGDQLHPFIRKDTQKPGPFSIIGDYSRMK